MCSDLLSRPPTSPPAGTTHTSSQEGHTYLTRGRPCERVWEGLVCTILKRTKNQTQDMWAANKPRNQIAAVWSRVSRGAVGLNDGAHPKC